MSVPSASRGANLLMGPMVPSVQISLRLLIPNGSAGTVIGRNGDTINRIRDLTGASIKVHREHPGRQLCWLRFIWLLGIATVGLLQLCISVWEAANCPLADAMSGRTADEKSRLPAQAAI